MAKSLRKWSKDYDLVLIDAPPVTVAADAVRLATQAGNLLFVVRPGIADKESIEYSQDILTQSKINSFLDFFDKSSRNILHINCRSPYRRKLILS